jgi:hypothetical protein
MPLMTTANVSDSITGDAVARTADIIPFPARPIPAEPTPVEPTPEARLARALASLNAALADQRAAVAAWREVLAELKATTIGLQGSLQRYRANLLTLGDSVSALHTKAQSLEQWADDATRAPQATGPVL